MRVGEPAAASNVAGRARRPCCGAQRADRGRVDRTDRGYLSGNIFISIIAGTSAFLVLEILRVPFAAALGV